MRLQHCSSQQFHFVRSISRSEARQVKRKVTNNLQKVVKKNLPVLSMTLM